MSVACSWCTFIYLPFDDRDGSIAPDPAEIFHRAVEEGERRLDQSLLEPVSTSFIAGFTIVFGIVALGSFTHWSNHVSVTLLGSQAHSSSLSKVSFPQGRRTH